MTDIARRFAKNPLLTPASIPASREDFHVECLLNPGVFEFDGKTWLLLRAAECPVQRDGYISTPVMDDNGNVKVIEFSRSDPKLLQTDPRVFEYDGNAYLTTMSHLVYVSANNAETFDISGARRLMGKGDTERFGIEDCRVTLIEGIYYLTYAAISPDGVGVGLMTTVDWRTFNRHGLIMAPHNKDCVLFPEKIHGQFVCLHRPTSPWLGGNFIWLAQSPDAMHWGGHRCIARPRRGMWDSNRIGAGSSPILTENGWLMLYHGVGEQEQYCLGAMLLDANDPSAVIARSDEPIMEPVESYEKKGFVGNVVFQNGHVRHGDDLVIYYGASDSVVCGAILSINTILSRLK